MSEKRRDNKGRILRTGESQRKNGMCEFRHTDANKKRRSIYDMDLMKLRQKEDEIKLLRHEGIDYAGGEITVIQLLEHYISLKRGVRYNTTTGYRFVMGVVQKEAFGQRIIRDIKMSDAKQWFIKLFDDGYSYSTIASIRGVVKPAFQMAYTEDIIRRNPFEFRLDIIPNNTQKRVTLSPKQQEQFLDYIRKDDHFCRYLEGFIQMTMILIIMGLFDRFFIGRYWIGHTKAWFIPKTEDLKPYIPLSKDYLDFILEELSELEEAIYYMVVNLAEYRGDGNL